MEWIKKVIRNRVFQSAAAWIFFVVVSALTSQYAQEQTAWEKLRPIIGILIFALAPILCFNLLILPLFEKKQWIKGALLTAVNILFFGWLGHNFRDLVNTLAELIGQNPVFISKSIGTRSLLNAIGSVFMVVVVGATLKISRDSLVRWQYNKKAELQLLKAQLNPHFLFNTLNNLYGLAVSKSDKLPNLMLQLSDLMRYSLYETQDQFVPLSKEIKYLENYIALERIRLEEQVQIEFNIEGDIARPTIAPMLLIVFVENAFKHLSAANNIEKVYISTTVLEDKIVFKCENSFDPAVPNHSLEKGKSGIGLANAQKRLALLYPKKHTFSANSQGELYTINLTLNS